MRIFGRHFVCAECGRPLFKAIPVMRNGEVRLIGAADHNVRVAFSGKESLALRHPELDQCPAPERPWVS